MFVVWKSFKKHIPVKLNMGPPTLIC